MIFKEKEKTIIQFGDGDVKFLVDNLDGEFPVMKFMNAKDEKVMVEIQFRSNDSIFSMEELVSSLSAFMTRCLGA